MVQSDILEESDVEIEILSEILLSSPVSTRSSSTFKSTISLSNVKQKLRSVVNVTAKIPVSRMVLSCSSFEHSTCDRTLSLAFAPNISGMGLQPSLMTAPKLAWIFFTHKGLRFHSFKSVSTSLLPLFWFNPGKNLAAC